MFVLAATLLGLIALLATLQYRWLGQISAAERERMRVNLTTRTDAFAMDVDRELTRAYLTYQLDPMQDDAALASRLAARHERWQGTARYPRLVKDVFVATRQPGESAVLQRFNPATGFVEPAEWPEAFQPIRSQIDAPVPEPANTGNVVVRTAVAPLWEKVPAIVALSPIVYISTSEAAPHTVADLGFRAGMRYTILFIDREYLVGEILPALAQQHFKAGSAEETTYEMAVVSTADKSPVFSTTAAMSLDDPVKADARATLFQVRVQDFSALATEVRRFTSFDAQLRQRIEQSASAATKSRAERETRTVRQVVVPKDSVSSFTFTEAPQISVLLSHGATDAAGLKQRGIEAGISGTALGRPAPSPARWQLVVKHPAGSLESAVANVRRRNLAISSGILAILGLSIGFLVVSTRRAQDLARQQMEFVAAVSHELRTPLAVIRSAADNLAEGVIREDTQVRQYGELVRGEGRRLSEMVEQILELAGIQSGQRGFALRPVALSPIVDDVLRASDTLIGDAGLQVEVEVPESLPPVLGDEPAIRRVVQNLVGNAIKYGKSGGWVGIRASTTSREVQLTVADRGIGIEPDVQAHIFDPFYRAPGVVEAQIQGAGLGLSLVQRIVEAHGGRIVVESTPGRGSAFTLHLPTASGRSSDSRDSAVAQGTPTPSSSAADAVPDAHGGASA
jgi:two-component system sensor histidine kinase SenX3